MSAVLIDLAGVDLGQVGITGWAVRKDADTVLTRLREHGLNAERCVELHPAFNRFFRFWVIARPDPLAEMTWLMDTDGTWARGRLYDDTGSGAPWVSMPGPGRVPATVTHNYRYSAGSIGVLGHDGKPLVTGDGLWGRPTEVLSWTAHVWCVACSWSTYHNDEGSARAAGRYHRANPQNKEE